MSLYHLNVTIHLLAAFLWLGGMFFLALVGAPVLRGVEPPALRAELFQRLGRRYRTAGWLAIAALLLTGVANLQFRGVLHGPTLRDPRFWETPFGEALAWKLAAVLVMLVVQAVHDFLVGPAASAATPGSREADRLRRWSAWLGRLNALVGIGLVIAALRLARGG
ncbi:MAG: DUF4149 domain-containing protein [Gemmatimonadota bacterium]